MGGNELSPVLVSLAAFSAAAALLAAVLALPGVRARERRAARILLVQRGAEAGEPAARAAGAGDWLRPVARLGEAVARSGLLSTKTLADLQTALQLAGLGGRAGVGLFVGAKLLLLLGLPVLVLVVTQRLGLFEDHRAIPMAGAAVLGLLLPDKVVSARRKRHLAALDRGLPDALDMLVICTEAGLGLEPAIERVGQEIRHAHPAVAQEFQGVLRDLHLNADRGAVLRAFSARTGLDGVRRLSTTLVQTMQYGTPLSQALRVLSAEMRQEMLTRFEARAARLPVLLTLPMIVFILPCVFLIVGGPALVGVVSSLGAK